MSPLLAWSGPFKVPMVSDGVVSAPVLLTVVEPVPPTARVFEVRAPVKKLVEVADARLVLPETVSAESVPTLVSDEAVMLDPKVDPERTLAPLIWKAAPVGMLTAVPEIVVVAVPPKYAVPKFEKTDEEAFANDWRPVQLLALARFKLMVALVPPICEPRVPETERVEPTASEVVATPDTPAAPLVEYRSWDEVRVEVVARP